MVVIYNGKDADSIIGASVIYNSINIDIVNMASSEAVNNDGKLIVDEFYDNYSLIFCVCKLSVAEIKALSMKAKIIYFDKTSTEEEVLKYREYATVIYDTHNSYTFMAYLWAATNMINPCNHKNYTTLKYSIEDLEEVDPTDDSCVIYYFKAPFFVSYFDVMFRKGLDKKKGSNYYYLADQIVRLDDADIDATEDLIDSATFKSKIEEYIEINKRGRLHS